MNRWGLRGSAGIAPLAFGGAAALAVALAGFLSDEAGAAGGDNPAAAMLQRNFSTSAPAFSFRSWPSERRAERGHARRLASQAGPAVCVRLCDGSYFPTSESAGDATCEAQCPDAPTALYRLRPGSDSIEDSVSTAGKPYTELPVAGRYRNVADNTCVCHRGKADYVRMALHDPTLRRGDAVMTASGVVVYEGVNSAARPQDFVALARATNLAADVRSSLGKLRSTEGPVATASAAKAKKGSVWVESTPKRR